MAAVSLSSSPAPGMIEGFFPAPHFEGSEKRVELTFALGADPRGLRALSRGQIDQLMTLAACEVVEARDSEEFDAYVLSESSLFVYPTRFVLKTCGTTRLLNAVPECVALAEELGLQVDRVRYSRASFLFPENQPLIYQDWNKEVDFLNQHFDGLPGGPSAYVLGDSQSGLQWHIYAADRTARSAQTLSRAPTYSLEVCMTELGREQADQFRRLHPAETAAQCTERTGIADMFKGSLIDDYVFDPCGYSMNGVFGKGLSTIHVTPEPECSFASCEASYWDPAKLDPAKLVADCTGVFMPGRMVVAMTTDADDAPAWDKHVLSFPTPAGYRSEGMAMQALSCGGRVTFLRFVLEDSSAVSTRPGSPKEGSVDIEAEIADLSQGIPAPLEVPSRDTVTPIYLPGGPVAAAKGPAAPRSPAGPAAAGERPSAGRVHRVLEAFSAETLPSAGRGDLDAHLAKLVSEGSLEDNFFVYDLGRLARAYEYWTETMPRVTPYYAVKCNPEPGIVSTLAALGCGFDCASKMEVDLALEHGGTPGKIIYANPCKRPSEIRALLSSGVDVTTFDSTDELIKIKQLHPECKVVLRIRADDPDARCRLGNKYGAELDAVPELLDAVAELELEMVGVSFHVGSGARNPNAFTDAIMKSRLVWDQATARGFRLTTLDIGGGFMLSIGKDGKMCMGAVPAAINTAIGTYFPESMGVDIIAEPGRFFAEHVGTLASQVFGRRVRADYANLDGALGHEYWLADGLYGSFNCVMYDGAEMSPDLYHALSHPALEPIGEEVHPSTVFGPTCDGLDTVLRNVQLPGLRVGDFLVFESFGAYTIAGACNFNGLVVDRVPTFYIYTESG